MSTKILLGFLIVALVVPAVFFTRPQKAEALVSLVACIAAKTTAGSVAGASAGVSSLLSVSVSDIVNTVTTAQGPAGTDWVSCFLKGLATIIAKTVLHTFVQSIVNWINSGFQGSPSFITNPEGFLNDIADKTVGRIIGQISPFLCAPFRLDLKFALGLDISLKNQREFECRLSTVIKNVDGAYNGFVNGAVGSGNLSRWINIAGTPQNNPYGAYIGVTNKMGLGITSATGQQTKLLDWGKGFMSWRSCKKRAPPIKDANQKVIRQGACTEEGEIKTPGSIIQDQTSGALGSTLRELEVAQEIDAVVGALINQLLTQVMRAGGGLLGASKGGVTGGGKGGKSAADRLSTNPKKALASSDAKTPNGINCRLRYYPSTIEKPLGSGIYVPDDSKNKVWTNNLNASTNTTTPFVEAGVSKGNETWAEYFTKVREGCENEFNTLIDNASTEGLGLVSGAAETSKKQKPPPVPKAPPNRAISLGLAGLNQSSTKTTNDNISLGPKFATYGSGFASKTDNSGSPNWWTASLNEPEKIKIIEVQYVKNTTVDEIRLINLPLINGINELAGIPITLADVANAPVIYKYPGGAGATVKTDKDRKVTITFTDPPEANALVIYNALAPLELESVQLFRPAEIPDAVEEPVSFTFTVSPLTPRQMNSPEPGSTFIWSGLSFAPNKPQDGISFRAQLYTCAIVSCNDSDKPYNSSPTSFFSYFDSLTFTYTVEDKLAIKNAILPPPAGEVATTYNLDQSKGGIVTGDASGVVFANNLSVKTSSVGISITGLFRGLFTVKMPFRIVVEALSAGAVVGTVKADFSPQ